MVKRFEWRRYGYLAFALIVMMMCWEMEKSSAAFASGGIPQDSIRLRILANSDTIEDQAVKRLIRDRIVEQMNAWVAEPEGIDAARRVIESRMPELQDLAERTLAERGFPYGAQVELGKVDFPTKMYGSRVYPAGQYEALRVTLGGGEGQNWWCVLFPPLCFVDAVSGEAVASDKPDAQHPQSAGVTTRADSGKSKEKDSSRKPSAAAGKDRVAKADPDVKDNAHPVQGDKGLQVESKEEVHFLIWDALKSFFNWVGSLFA